MARRMILTYMSAHSMASTASVLTADRRARMLRPPQLQPLLVPVLLSAPAPNDVLPWEGAVQGW